MGYNVDEPNRQWLLWQHKKNIFIKNLLIKNKLIIFKPRMFDWIWVSEHNTKIKTSFTN